MPVEEKSKPTETIAVIGAGLAGAMSAIYLAKAGYQVVLIERQDRPLMVSSKIPVHLHSGGLYSGEVAKHCLHDSINFMQALPFAVTQRPTAFAIMTLDDTKTRASGMTQLEEAAFSICKKQNGDWQNQKEQYKAMAQEEQSNKWSAMNKNFEMLQATYKHMVENSSENKVFGEVSHFYKAYDQREFSEYKDRATNISHDPDVTDKDAWTKQLARVSDPSQVLGVIMSSEVGLNMMRAGAGIEIELEKLIAEGKLHLLVNAQVMSVVHNKNETFDLELKFNGAEDILPLKVMQVVNATGYRGKEMDMEMGLQTNWFVDIKGAGVIEFINENFNHVPEVFFTEGIGMSHLSRFNNTMAGINYCDPEVEATYVKGGKIEYKENESLNSNEKLAALEATILNKPVDDPSLLVRTQRDIDCVARFMPSLPDAAVPRAYVAGALGTLGNMDARDSKEVYYSKSGYHAINLAKGGGAVSTAMTLVNHVEIESIKKKRLSDTSRHFPNNSYSTIPENFKLTGTNESLSVTLNNRASQRASAMNMNTSVSLKY